MTVKLNDKEYQFELQSQIGIYYFYEVTFGSVYLEDMKTMSSASILVRYCYCILQLCNPNLDITFNQFISFVGDDEFFKMRDYVNDRLSTIAQDKGDMVTEDSEDGTKKA